MGGSAVGQGKNGVGLPCVRDKEGSAEWERDSMEGARQTAGPPPGS